MFSWKEDYNTGLPEIDEQHKRLFELGSNIFSLVNSKDGADHYDEIILILDDLRQYTVYHFHYEEKYQLSINYKNYDEHKVLHDDLIDKLTNIETTNIDSMQGTVMIQLLDFIASWIGNHILKEDFKYLE